MLQRVALTVSLASCIAVAGCGDDGGSIDVSGEYTAALTNRDNGCNLGNWTVGESTTGVMVTISQNGGAVSADVKGLAGAALDFLLEGHVFTGNADGEHVDLKIIGTRSQSMGACAYTYDATLVGTLDGNSLGGAVIYQAKTNAAADCGALTGCSSRQDFAGSRPPQ